MDDSRQLIRKPADKNLLDILEFAAWVKEWNCQAKRSLAQQTATAVHMLIEREFEYVLFGQFQSDVIEQRFG